MPGEISINPVTPLPSSGAQDRQAATADSDASATVVASLPPMHLNPMMVIDPQLNIVIMEFADAAGTVTSTVPTAHALEQFRLNLMPVGPGPAAHSDADPALQAAPALVAGVQPHQNDQNA